MPEPDHVLTPDDGLHTDWDRARDPALTVESGAVVEFDCMDANGGEITPDSEAADLRDPDFEGHHLTGPVAVEGMRPGDVLEVELLDATVGDWGFTLFRAGEQGAGLLPEEFPDPGLHHWDLSDVDRDGWVEFVDGIGVPVDPFPGCVGVVPAAEGPHHTAPPRHVGGNLDVKHLTAGSTLYLPVEVEGGLFSMGDGHAAQGDGEVCVSAIEAPATFTVRLTRRPDLSIERPEFHTTGPFTATGEDVPAYATSGVADSLLEASKQAVRGMIRHLSEERGLSRGEAYILCSVAVDLKVNEVVDDPNWVVSAYLPEALFE